MNSEKQHVSIRRSDRLRNCVYWVVGVGITMPAQGSVEADRGLVDRGQASLCRGSSERWCAGRLRWLRRARSIPPSAP
jgi:hypothetical protein